MPRLHHLLTFLLTTLPPLILTQLIPNDLPSCAQGCTILQQGQTGCVPAGGAPEAPQGTYQSCFCQSALLTQLYSNTAVQLCANCAAGDMATIQNWYQTYCGKGGSQVAAPGGNGNGQQTQTQGQGQQQTTPTVQATTDPTTTSAGANTQAGQNVGGVSVANADASKGPWWSTHWKWVLMLIIIIVGLTAIAIGGWFLHRRYHRRREARWALGPGSQPNINTWGPGQSVHDLGYGAGAATAAGGHRAGAGDAEKGKMREGGASEVRRPKRSRRIGRKRESGGLF